jgi:hypothetical protein
MSIATVSNGEFTLSILQQDDRYMSNLSTTALAELIDNAPTNFTLDELLQTLVYGKEHLNANTLSAKSLDRINMWVKNLGKYSYTWSELLDKPNYALELFKKRFWPFYQVESKDWKETAMDAKSESEPYPTQITNANTNTDDADYKEESDTLQRYNNYLGYAVLDPNQYPDLDKILTRLKHINTIGLKHTLFEAALRLMITPSTCHIIKEKVFWDLINPMIVNPEHKNIFVHFMYYAMFIMHHEELIMFSKVKLTHRVIFTHVEALNMPDLNLFHVDADPYIQQLTNENYTPDSMPFYYRCKRHVNPIDVFERRLYLATGGAIAGIDLHRYKAAVSGSILIPCVYNFEGENTFVNLRFDTDVETGHNLYDFNGTLTEEEKNFMSYLEYLYPSYFSYLPHDFKVNVMSPPTTESASTNTTTNSDEAKSNVVQKTYNEIADIDISITAETYDIFEELALMLGKQIQKNCEHRGQVWIKKVQTLSSFKYCIYGSGLIRPIDLFRIPYNPARMTKKFHVPIVRMWYDGCNHYYADHPRFYETNINSEVIKYNINRIKYDDVKYDDVKYDDVKYDDVKYDDVKYDDEQTDPNGQNIANTTPETLDTIIGNTYYGIHIFRSSLCAGLSGVNESYKWFSCNKVPIDVILKYAQRFVSTAVNETERVACSTFMATSDRWKPFTKISGYTYGSMSKNHQFFNPCSLNAGIRMGLREYKKPVVVYRNYKNSVGYPTVITEYDATLAVKDCNRIHKPSINTINAFIDHVKQKDGDLYLDAVSY